jgi:hypothetical protein
MGDTEQRGAGCRSGACQQPSASDVTCRGCSGSGTRAQCVSDCGQLSSVRDECDVQGGSSSEPADLGSVLATANSCAVFVLGDGYYDAVTIERSGIIIRAANPCGARFRAELEIRASNVLVEGVSVTTAETGITVFKPGVYVRNSCISDFGKAVYGNGIWIFQEALDDNNRIRIEHNVFDNWGGHVNSGAIVIGRSDDDPMSHTRVTVEVVKNRITGGAPSDKDDIWNSAIQAYHPFIAYGNYIDTLNGTAIQNKTFNSYIACNVIVNNLGVGALYNRYYGSNVWEFNVVHDSFMGFEHFAGDSNVFRSNVIYNTTYIGRIKNHWPGSTNLLIANNTFYNISGWAGWIWDPDSPGFLSNIVWRNNIFSTVNGDAIADELKFAWDEYANDFYRSSAPSGTTGASSQSSITRDPRLVDPPADFRVSEPLATLMGAPWPLPCQ